MAREHKREIDISADGVLDDDLMWMVERLDAFLHTKTSTWASGHFKFDWMVSDEAGVTSARTVDALRADMNGSRHPVKYGQVQCARGDGP